MNQTFSLFRFLLLLRLEFAERGRNNLIIAAILIVALLAMMLPVTVADGFIPVLTMLPALALFMVVMFGGSLYTTQLFTKYGPPETAIPSLMVPASTFEKFLSALLLHVLFAVLLMGLYLYLQNWTIDYANSKIPEGSQKYGKLPADAIQYFVGLYAATQGLTFLGSLYFPKSAYIKSLITFTVLFAAITILNLVLANQFTNYPSSLTSFPFSSWRVANYKVGQYFTVEPSVATLNFIYMIPVITLLACWAITYVRLKEKEI